MWFYISGLAADPGQWTTTGGPAVDQTTATTTGNTQVATHETEAHTTGQGSRQASRHGQEVSFPGAGKYPTKL